MVRHGNDVSTSGNKLPTVNTASHKLPTVTTNHKHKLPTVKLLACIHGMQKGDGGEGGMWRVVSGKGQILTTYRGPSSREREGRGGTRPGKRVFLFDNHSFQLAYNPTHLISLQYITYTHIN